MRWRFTFYSLMQGGWLFLVAAGFVVVDIGLGDPFVPPALAQAARIDRGLATLGLAVVGVVGFGLLRRRAWRTIGRRAGLSTDPSTIGPLGLVSAKSIEGSLFELFPEPDLRGTVDGRDVRVHTYTVSTGGGEDGGNSESYTLVEASLAAPIEQGLMLGAGDPDSTEQLTDIVPAELETEALGDGLVVVGGPDAPARAQELLSGAARQALLDCQESGGVTVGDPTDAIVEAIPDEIGAFVGFVPGAELENSLRDHPPFDPETVAINAKGRTADPERLQDHVRAVAAVANSVEQATAATPEL